MKAELLKELETLIGRIQFVAGEDIENTWEHDFFINVFFGYTLRQCSPKQDIRMRKILETTAFESLSIHHLRHDILTLYATAIGQRLGKWLIKKSWEIVRAIQDDDYHAYKKATTLDISETLEKYVPKEVLEKPKPAPMPKIDLTDKNLLDYLKANPIAPKHQIHYAFSSKGHLVDAAIKALEAKGSIKITRRSGYPNQYEIIEPKKVVDVKSLMKPIDGGNVSKLRRIDFSKQGRKRRLKALNG